MTRSNSLTVSSVVSGVDIPPILQIPLLTKIICDQTVTEDGMPHLCVHVLESDLVGRETALIQKLTDAVVAVYGEWARSIAVVQLIGLPPNRWGIGGTPAQAPSPSVTFGIREAAFGRPDADEIVARLVSGVTDAIVDVFGERVRAGVTVELVGTPAGRTGIGGVVVTS
jgi:phenylpyruvate tautomerase PptA (4-oxalocrotonate tautomerase family)